MTEIELKIPFDKAIEEAKRILGSNMYYLHNRVGSQDWMVRHHRGRVYLQTKDPRMAVYFKLKL